MTPRQARRERRAAERKAKKLELKKARLAQNEPANLVDDEFLQIEADLLSTAPLSSLEEMPAAAPAFKAPADHPSEIGFVSQNNPSRAEINRANAQFSTGPTSSNGKLASSRNSTKHGLASGTLIIPGEDPAQFESLLGTLLQEHQPATETETLLIEQMAQSHWLAQRALRLQNDCFTFSVRGAAETPAVLRGSPDAVDQKQLALYLRYFTTHNRAFHKALADLHKLQKERRKAETGFVSQKPARPSAQPGFVSQTSPQPAPDEEFLLQNCSPSEPQIGFVSQTEAFSRAEPAQSMKRAA